MINLLDVQKSFFILLENKSKIQIADYSDITDIDSED